MKNLASSNDDEVRFSFNNENFKNKFMSIEKDFLPDKYLEIDTNRGFEKTRKTKKLEESRNHHISDKNKEKIMKSVDNDQLDPQNPENRDSHKIFNFTDSSDDNDDNNFFSSPKLSNHNVALNQHLSIKEKKTETTKSSKNQLLKKGSTKKKEKMKENEIITEDVQQDTISVSEKSNITKNSIKNMDKSKISSPKNKRETTNNNENNSKAKMTNDTRNNAKKTVTTIVRKKNKSRSKSNSRSKSKSKLKIIKKKIEEKQFHDNEKKENEKLKEEVKKLKEENKQLKALLDKEKARNEKFNNLAEEFIKLRVKYYFKLGKIKLKIYKTKFIHLLNEYCVLVKNLI